MSSRLGLEEGFLQISALFRSTEICALCMGSREDSTLIGILCADHDPSRHWTKNIRQTGGVLSFLWLELNEKCVLDWRVLLG